MPQTTNYGFPLLAATPPEGMTGKDLRDLILGEGEDSLAQKLDAALKNVEDTIPSAQVQADWSQTDNTQLDYIKNKPCYYLGNRGSVTFGSGLETYVKKTETANPNVYTADELANDRLTFHHSSNPQKVYGVYEAEDDIPTGSYGLLRIPNEKIVVSKARLVNGIYLPAGIIADAIFGGYYLYFKSSDGTIKEKEKIILINKPFTDPINIKYIINDSGGGAETTITTEETGIIILFTVFLGTSARRLTPFVFDYDIGKLKKLDEVMMPDSVAKKSDIIDSYTKAESDAALKAVEDKIPSLEGYYTKEQTDEAIKAAENKIPSLEGYYTKNETDENFFEKCNSSWIYGICLL